MNKFLSVAILAALGMSLVATDASAFGGRRKRSKGCTSGYTAPVTNSCCGSTGYGSQSGYGYANQPGYGYANQSGYGYTTAMPAMTMPATSTTSESKPGIVTVMVPNADAEVWFEDTALPQTGKERTFNTPALVEGKTYNYTVKAKWMTAGKPVEKTLPVSVRAGQTSTVDFR